MLGLSRFLAAATLICVSCCICEPAAAQDDIVVIDGATAAGKVARPRIVKVPPGRMCEIPSDTPITQWLIVQPADLPVQVYDRVEGKDGSRLVFQAPNSGKVIIWRFQGQNESAFPVMTSFVVQVEGTPPDNPDNPDNPPGPGPGPGPAPVVPNALGVGQPVFDAAMTLNVNHRKAYAEKIAQVWSATGARLAATSDPIDPAMEAIADDTRRLLGADSRVWEPYGNAVEKAIQAALDAGRLKKTDRAQVVALCKEVAGALTLAGRQP